MRYSPILIGKWYNYAPNQLEFRNAMIAKKETRRGWRNAGAKARRRRRGQCFGAGGGWARQISRRRLSERLGRRERKETDEQLAERLMQEWLSSHDWTEAGLKASAKGDPRKAELAKLLRCHTPMSRSWMARRLHIGSASYVSHLISHPPFIVDCVTPFWNRNRNCCRWWPRTRRRSMSKSQRSAAAPQALTAGEIRSAKALALSGLMTLK